MTYFDEFRNLYSGKKEKNFNVTCANCKRIIEDIEKPCKRCVDEQQAKVNLGDITIDGHSIFNTNSPYYDDSSGRKKPDSP